MISEKSVGSKFLSVEGRDGLLRAFRSEDVCRLEDTVIDGEGLFVAVSLYDGTQLTLKSTVAALLKLINILEK